MTLTTEEKCDQKESYLFDNLKIISSIIIYSFAGYIKEEMKLRQKDMWGFEGMIDEQYPELVNIEEY